MKEASEVPEKVGGSKVWEKIKKSAEKASLAIALVAGLEGSGCSVAPSKEFVDDLKSGNRDKIEKELGLEETARLEKRLMELVGTQGDFRIKGDKIIHEYSVGDIGNFQTIFERRSDGSLGKPEQMLIAVGDEQAVCIDNDCDGSLDRIIINHAEKQVKVGRGDGPIEQGQESTVYLNITSSRENRILASEPLDSVEDMAKEYPSPIVAKTRSNDVGIPRRNIRVIEYGQDDYTKNILKTEVNFQDGNTRKEAMDETSLEYREKQEIFRNMLEYTVDGIEKGEADKEIQWEKKLS